MILLAAAFLAAGCSHEQRPSQQAATEWRGTPHAANRHRPMDLVKSTKLVVDRRIGKACATPEIRFDLDSDVVAADAQLDRLADCLETGPLAGRSVTLVGHTDPRGGWNHNMALGQRRADHVAAYLESRGVSVDRLTTATRGEMDANANDEYAMYDERAVEIRLQ